MIVRKVQKKEEKKETVTGQESYQFTMLQTVFSTINNRYLIQNLTFAFLFSLLKNIYFK